MVKFSASLILLAIAAISTSAAPIKSSSSSSTDDIPIDKFSPSVKHSGKATWFTHTYGACNIHWDGYKEPTVALNAYQMGAASWGNPACDRRVRVTNKKNGKSVEARIVDKCPGDECAWGSLDLSPAAFKRLGELDTGILNIEWQYLH